MTQIKTILVDIFGENLTNILSTILKNRGVRLLPRKLYAHKILLQKYHLGAAHLGP